MPADFDRIAREITPGQLAEAIGTERVGSKFRCPMPDSHERSDKTPSFSSWRDGDRTAAMCHVSTCPLGKTMTPVQVAAKVWGVGQAEAGTRLAEMLGIPTTSAKREVIDTYDYVDESADVLFQVVRYRPKSFRQRQPDGDGGWIWSLAGVRRVLYQLPKVLEAVEASETIFVVEGERDVHAVEDEGGVATTAPGGAGKWSPEYSETLRGAHVVIVADRDDAGRAHAWSVASALEGIAASLQVVGAKEGSDAADHLATGHGLEDFEPVPPTEISVPVGLPYHPLLGATEIGTYVTLAAALAMGQHPSRREIAAIAKCSISTVDRARKRLRRAGFIDWSRGAGNQRKPCRYRLKPTRHYDDLAVPTHHYGESSRSPTTRNDGSGPPTSREWGRSCYGGRASGSAQTHARSEEPQVAAGDGSASPSRVTGRDHDAPPDADDQPTTSPLPESPQDDRLVDYDPATDTGYL